MPERDPLNAHQNQAVTHSTGPLLIVAGAGAGKTKTITHRIGRLIEQGVRPQAILAITFTNKAAHEMRERVTKLLQELEPTGRSQGSPFVSTFHTLGVHIIRHNCQALGLTPYFSIADRDESLSAVKEALKQAGYDPKQFEPRKILGAISREKGKGIGVEEYGMKSGGEFWGSVVGEVWQKYEKVLKERQALDFDDLLLRAVRLLQREPAILAKYHAQWTHIHVDEYQDTNVIQYELAKLLASKHRNLCVVGDVDQSIYSWRGADYRNLLTFEKDYPDATVITLEENYRSTKTIIAAANEVIKKNRARRPKNLFTQNPLGEKITLRTTLDENEEAAVVVEACQGLVQAGVKPEEIAVLYRANFQSRALEEACLRAGLPYRVLGTKFFDRAEVKDVLTLIKAALNPSDVEAIKRIINVPPRGIGKATLAKVVTGQETTLPAKTRAKVAEFRAMLAAIKTQVEQAKPSQALKFTIHQSGYDAALRDNTEEGAERLGNLHELVTLGVRYDNDETPSAGMWRLLTEAALVSDQDTPAQNQSGINLITVHAAKGLEFKQVFIVGLEQDLFPFSRLSGEDSDRDDEEERRLFYVAVTRAKEKLSLSYAQTRTLYGSRRVNAPSEFIADIPSELLEVKTNLIDFNSKWIEF